MQGDHSPHGPSEAGLGHLGSSEQSCFSVYKGCLILFSSPSRKEHPLPPYCSGWHTLVLDLTGGGNPSISQLALQSLQTKGQELHLASTGHCLKHGKVVLLSKEIFMNAYLNSSPSSPGGCAQVLEVLFSPLQGWPPF